MESTNRPEPRIEFDAAQLEYLEKLFPSRVLSSRTSEAEMRHYFGEQAVIDAVRRKTRGRSKNIRDTSSIPAPR